MRKSALTFLLITLPLGVCGAVLRLLELKTAVEPGGLTAFRPVTVILLALTVLAALFYALLAKKTQPRQSERLGCLWPERLAWLPISLAGAALLLLLLGAYPLFLDWKAGVPLLSGYGKGGTVLKLLLAALALLSGAGGLYAALAARSKELRAGELLLAGSMQTLFLCLRLVVFYQQHAPIPSLVITGYPFLALCAGVLAAYLLTGAAVGRQKPRWALFFCGVGLFLALLSAVGEETAGDRFFFWAQALQLLSGGLSLLWAFPGEEA